MRKYLFLFLNKSFLSHSILWTFLFHKNCWFSVKSSNMFNLIFALFLSSSPAFSSFFPHQWMWLNQFYGVWLSVLILCSCSTHSPLRLLITDSLDCAVITSSLTLPSASLRAAWTISRLADSFATAVHFFCTLSSSWTMRKDWSWLILLCLDCCFSTWSTRSAVLLWLWKIYV